jgi:hypothetical protein
MIHRVKAIKSLAKHVNIWDSDAVEKHINEAEWTNGRKEHVALAYSNWCESKGFEYTPRKYPRQIKLPYIPTEKEIDQLIGGFSDSKYGPFLQLLKETARAETSYKEKLPIVQIPLMPFEVNGVDALIKVSAVLFPE